MLETLVTLLSDRLQRHFLHELISASLIVPFILHVVAAENGDLPGVEGWRDGKEGSVMKQASAVVEELIKREGRMEFDKMAKMNIRCQSSSTIVDTSDL